MGYQEITLDKTIRWCAMTVTFDEIGDQDYDLQKIRVIDTNTGAEFATGNRVKLQVIADDDPNANPTTGKIGTQFIWKKVNNELGWYTADNAEPTFKLGKAQCVVINNLFSSRDLKLRVSGEVNLNPVSLRVPKSSWQYVGNMTPCPVDIQDVKPYNGDAVLASGNRVKIQCIRSDDPNSNTETGKLGTQYTWKKVGTDFGWYDSSNNACTFTLAPGEGFIVNNLFTGADYLTIHFPSPIK